jgi:hypothetical protein
LAWLNRLYLTQSQLLYSHPSLFPVRSVHHFSSSSVSYSKMPASGILNTKAT